MKTTALIPNTTTATTSLEKLYSLWQNQPFADTGSLPDYTSLAIANPALNLILNQGPCLTWVLDVRTRQFVYLSENVKQFTGYQLATFKKNSYSVWTSFICPSDRPLINSITLKLWENFLQLPADTRRGYCFNRKYRFRKSDGSFVYLLEQNKVLQTDLQGNITHLLGTCTNITDLVQGQVFRATVQATVPQATSRPTGPPNQTATHIKLSDREKEIVRLVAEGYSSKVIAEQLFISFHTVNTHRKNIIGKTHSKNTGGLVQFAISNQII